MNDNQPAPPCPNRGTILLASGEMDKALIAFELACGMQAMGTQITIWFVLYGVDCIKKNRSPFALSRLWPRRKTRKAPGRNPETDSPLQQILQAVAHDGPAHVPLSQHNYLGAGPALLKRIMGKKGMASLEELIYAAQRLGVNFKICQICVDAMACDVEQDLLVEAEVAGVSQYAIEVRQCHYNVVI
jgi:peroxiredoxin family protein